MRAIFLANLRTYVFVFKINYSCCAVVFRNFLSYLPAANKLNTVSWEDDDSRHLGSADEGGEDSHSVVSIASGITVPQQR